jgi:hypothetical protein
MLILYDFRADHLQKDDRIRHFRSNKSFVTHSTFFYENGRSKKGIRGYARSLIYTTAACSMLSAILFSLFSYYILFIPVSLLFLMQDFIMDITIPTKAKVLMLHGIFFKLF